VIGLHAASEPQKGPLSRNTCGLRFVSRSQLAQWWRAMPDPDPREQFHLRLWLHAIEANLRAVKRLAHERARTELLRKRIAAMCEELEARLH
jgi:hypothetical protein